MFRNLITSVVDPEDPHLQDVAERGQIAACLCKQGVFYKENLRRTLDYEATKYFFHKWLAEDED